MNISDNTHISVSLVDDGEMKKLNKKHRGEESSTDVLSFNIDEETEDGRLYLGDIVVNVDQAKKQAKGTLEEEISELVAHGVLHLLGVHHKGDGH